MYTLGKTCFQKAAAAAQNSVLGTGGSAHRSANQEGCYVDHGHHALMNIALFRQVGGYNAAMSHNEDAELDHRLGRHGKIWLEPSCMITYYPRSSPAALWRQYYNYGKGRAQTIQLHRLRPKIRQLVPLLAPAACAFAVAAPLAGWPFGLLLLLPLIGWLGLCGTLGLLIGLRHRSACEAASGVAAAIMHLAWGLGFLGQLLGGRKPTPAPAPLLEASR
jgi:succinoglycan biosynthesis protein ExoA